MTRYRAAALLLAFALVAPAALHADRPARGAVVAMTGEYLVIATDQGGRRLFVLDEVVPPADLRAGDRVAVAFAVGDDNELHAVTVGHDADAAAPRASGLRRPGLVAILAAAVLGPAGMAIAPLITG